MMQNELAKLRLQAMLEQLGQQQEQSYNDQVAQQEMLSRQLEAANYAMPTASSSYGDWNPMLTAPGNVGSTINNATNNSSSYGNWNPMTGAPGNVGSAVANTTASSYGNWNPMTGAPGNVGTTVANTTTPALTGAEALGPHVTWDGVDKRLASDPFGIRQLIAGAGNTTVQNLTTPTTTVPTTTVPTTTVQNSINGTSNPYNIQAPPATTTSNTSITGDDDPYGIKALLNKQSSDISGLSNDLSFVKKQAQPRQNMGYAADPYSKEQWTPTDMYKNNVPRETPSFNMGGSGLGSLIRGA